MGIKNEVKVYEDGVDFAKNENGQPYVLLPDGTIEYDLSVIQEWKGKYTIKEIDSTTGNNELGSFQEVNSADQLQIALEKGLEGVFSNPPEVDVLYGNDGNDIIFGDGVEIQKIINEHKDEIKLVDKDGMPIDIDDSSNWGQIIQVHPEWFNISKDSVSLTPGKPPVEFDMSDAIYGGTGNDILYGQGGNDLLFGDGANSGTASSNETLTALDELGIKSEKPSDVYKQISTKNPEEIADFAAKIEEKIEQSTDGDDILFGGTGNDVLFGGGGDDKLYGGADSDYLFGGSGDDYLDGGDGSDVLMGGSGNDIITFDHKDALIDGGADVDLLISDNHEDNLKAILANKDGNPKVQNVEMLLRPRDESTKEEAANRLDVTSMADVAALGIVVSGTHIVIDSNAWEIDTTTSSSDTRFVTYVSKDNAGHKLALDVDREHATVNEVALDDELKDFLLAHKGANILNGEDFKDGAIFGSQGVDVIHGTNGDDFISGGDGRDWLYGGEGNDIILIDDTDYLVDGGKDIDIVLAAGQNNPTLSQMLANGDESNSETFASKDIPMVRDVEVMISGNVDGISSMDNLQAKNVNLVQTGDGHKLSLGNGWKKVEKPEADKDDVADKYATETWQYGDGDDALFLETTLAVEEAQKRLRALNRLRRPMAEDGRDNAIPADADKVDSEKTDADKVDSDKTDADNGPKTDDDNQDPAISKDDSQGTVDEESEAAETPPADGGSLADAGNSADKQPGNNRPADDQPDKKDKSDMDDRPANDEPKEDGADDGQKPVESPENRLDEDDAASKPVKDEVESRPSDSWKLDAEKNESRPADRDDAGKADDKDTGQPEDKSLLSNADDKSDADKGTDDSSSRPAENKAGDKEDSSSRPAENKVGSGEAGKTADSHADDFMTGDTGSGMTDSLNDAIQTAQVQINADTGGGL